MMEGQYLNNNESKNVDLLLTYLDILDDAIVGLTNDFRISFWSKGAEKELGYSRREMINKSLEVLVPIEKLEQFELKKREVRNGKTIKNLETTRIHKNGSVVDVSISISPILDNDGNQIGALGIYKDISEKRELANKLQEYERTSRLALEGGKFGIWDYDLEEGILRHHNDWKGFLGYDEDEIEDKHDSWLTLIHPDDVEDVISRFNFTNRDEYISEYRIRCKNGQYIWVRSKGVVSQWSDYNKPLRVVGTNEDITDRKIIEQKLKEKVLQLKRLKQHAENASSAKSQFLANIAHGIRTPINGINGIIQLLELTNDKTEQSKYIKMLKDTTKTLNGIVGDILDLSKIESGTLTLNYEPFDLAKTINDIYNHLLINGNSKGLEVGFYVDPTLDFQIVGDELKLRQILANLTQNALKFTDEGFVSLRINKVSMDKDYEEIEFVVKDSGFGIGEDIKEQIFQQFIQGETLVEKKHLGSGLGLAIAKQLADLMDAKIWFESIEGKGSSFYLRCKFKRLITSASENIEGQNEIRKIEKDNISSKERVILCVEDNIINQEVLGSLIKRKGYKYIPAYNGEEALKILTEYKVDLVIMDIQMPKLNGFETTKIIRNNESLKDVPIIAITAYALREDREKCIKAGMNDYISKPFDMERLYNLLEQYLQ